MKRRTKKFDRNKGITLIALVITIVVLLILAGVTIATLTGDNGLLKRAQDAKNKTEQAQKDEQNILNNYEDKLNEYTGINWNEAMANAKAPEEQETTSKNVIGLGTNGRSVNMDLWEYNFDDTTNGYGLNDSTSLTATASADASKGYNGMDFDNIVIPQYISTDDGENWTPVTNLDWLFYNCTELEQISKLPDTVKSMRYTFRGCTNLDEICELPNGLENMLSTFMQTGITKAPIIPQSVNNMTGTFNSCSSLIEPPVIPNGVTSLRITFLNCTALKYAPNIPDSVETMESTFEGCTSLETATTIPSSVTNIIKTYRGCINLRGKLEINANITGKTFLGDDGYERVDYSDVLYNATGEGLSLKLSGSCEFLNEIITQANNPRITL